MACSELKTRVSKLEMCIEQLQGTVTLQLFNRSLSGNAPARLCPSMSASADVAVSAEARSNSPSPAIGSDFEDGARSSSPSPVVGLDFERSGPVLAALSPPLNLVLRIL